MKPLSHSYLQFQPHMHNYKENDYIDPSSYTIHLKISDIKNELEIALSKIMCMIQQDYHHIGHHDYHDHYYHHNCQYYNENKNIHYMNLANNPDIGSNNEVICGTKPHGKSNQQQQQYHKLYKQHNLETLTNLCEKLYGIKSLISNKYHDIHKYMVSLKLEEQYMVSVGLAFKTFMLNFTKNPNTSTNLHDFNAQIQPIIQKLTWLDDYNNNNNNTHHLDFEFNTNNLLDFSHLTESNIKPLCGSNNHNISFGVNISNIPFKTPINSRAMSKDRLIFDEFPDIDNLYSRIRQLEDLLSIHKEEIRIKDLKINYFESLMTDTKEANANNNNPVSNITSNSNLPKCLSANSGLEIKKVMPTSTTTTTTIKKNPELAMLNITRKDRIMASNDTIHNNIKVNNYLTTINPINGEICTSSSDKKSHTDDTLTDDHKQTIDIKEVQKILRYTDFADINEKEDTSSKQPKKHEPIHPMVSSYQAYCVYKTEPNDNGLQAITTTHQITEKNDVEKAMTSSSKIPSIKVCNSGNTLNKKANNHNRSLSMLQMNRLPKTVQLTFFNRENKSNVGLNKKSNDRILQTNNNIINHANSQISIEQNQQLQKGIPALKKDQNQHHKKLESPKKPLDLCLRTTNSEHIEPNENIPPASFMLKASNQQPIYPLSLQTSNSPKRSDTIPTEQYHPSNRTRLQITNDLKGTRDDPKGMREDPKSTRDDPKSTRDDPKSTGNDPKGTRDDPKSTRDEPKGTKGDPKSIRDDPKTIRDDPKGNKRDTCTKKFIIPINMLGYSTFGSLRGSSKHDTMMLYNSSMNHSPKSSRIRSHLDQLDPKRDIKPPCSARETKCV